MRYLIKYLTLIFLVYIYFHNPFFIPTFGVLGRADVQYSIILLYIISLVYLVFHQPRVSDFFSCFRKEMTFIFVLLLFSIVQYIIARDGRVFSYHVQLLFTSFLIPVFLVNFCFSLNIKTQKSFFQLLIIVGVVALISTIICMTNEGLRDSYISSLHLDTGNVLFESFRGYGFSTKLTSDFGYIQGLMAVFIVYYFADKKWTLPIAILLLLSALFNARTGFLLGVIGCGVTLFFQKRLSSFFFIIISGVVIIALFPSILAYVIERTGLGYGTTFWLTTFFGDISSVSRGGSIVDTGVGETMFVNMFILPDSFVSWFIGNGYDIFHGSPRGYSDLGYIRQLYYGGLIYLGVILAYAYFMIKRLYMSGEKFLSILFLLSVLILNTKCSLFWDTGGVLGLLVFVYYFVIYSKNTQNS